MNKRKMQVIAYVDRREKRNSVRVYQSDSEAGEKLNKPCEFINLVGSLTNQDEVNDLIHNLLIIKKWLPK